MEAEKVRSNIFSLLKIFLSKKVGLENVVFVGFINRQTFTTNNILVFKIK